jgi:hypothetical protein
MRASKRKHTLVSDDAVSWIAAGIALVAAIVFGHYGLSQKWHAAIMWTGVAFASSAIFCRKQWTSLSFWAKWTAYLILHLAAMWFVFAYLLARLRVVGMLFVVPIAGA